MANDRSTIHAQPEPSIARRTASNHGPPEALGSAPMEAAGSRSKQSERTKTRVPAKTAVAKTSGKGHVGAVAEPVREESGLHLFTRGRVTKEFNAVESEEGWSMVRPLAGRAPSPEYFDAIRDALIRLAGEAGSKVRSKKGSKAA